MKAIEQYFHVILFIMLYNVVLTFKSVDETLVCDYSNESYWAVPSFGTSYYAVQGSCNFSSGDKLLVLITNLPSDSSSFQHSSVPELRLNFVLVKLASNHLLIRSNTSVMTKYTQ